MNKVKSRKRLNIDRKMMGILSFVAILGMCLVFMVVLATNSISALRAFSTLQTFWTEARKDAANELVQYIQYSDKRHLADFNKSMRFIERATEMKNELIKEQPDIDRIRANMDELRIRAPDIDNMVTTYRRYRFFSVFEEAIANWEKSDSLVYQFYDIAAMAPGIENDPDINKDGLINKVNTIDEKLDQLQYNLAYHLGEGGMLLNRLILGVGIFLGSILLIISGILSFRFMKNIKGWSRQIRESEQRYKSLFEQNPNAVFSMNREGEIQSGNGRFAKIFKNEESEWAISHFSDLLVEEKPRETQKKLDKVKRGTPLSFDVQWDKNQENTVYLQTIIMPIIVENDVVGMFGIAEDVTFTKEAEAQIKHQLEEKTVLLAEIHHRVKNNLAVISGLLELQRGALQETAALRALGEAQTRIQSIAMIHEMIYQNDSLADINFRNYVEELAEMIAGSFVSKEKDICLHINAENVAISLDQSIPCGLIINELISNAYEHGFKDKEQGNIWISFTQNNGAVKIVVADDGVGLPNNWKEVQSETLGLTLVQTLSSQLGGTCTIGNGDTTRFEIIFDKLDQLGKDFH